MVKLEVLENCLCLPFPCLSSLPSFLPVFLLLLLLFSPLLPLLFLLFLLLLLFLLYLLFFFYFDSTGNQSSRTLYRLGKSSTIELKRTSFFLTFVINHIDKKKKVPLSLISQTNEITFQYTTGDLGEPGYYESNTIETTRGAQFSVDSSLSLLLQFLMEKSECTCL